MIDTRRLVNQLPGRQNADLELGPEPTKEELRDVVRRLKSGGLCGRRIAEHQLGPYFIASDEHGQREIELLDAVLDEEYADTNLCVRRRRSECSRFRGGCKGSK